MKDNFLNVIDNYYTKKIEEHGKTAKGVDWNNEESQKTRFKKLLSFVLNDSKFQINDLGCGYGALLNYLCEHGYKEFLYTGYDISSKMIEMAHSGTEYINLNDFEYKFVHIKNTYEMLDSDLTVASGIFNVKLDIDDNDWLSYLLSTIDMMYEKSRYGYAFNCLSKYSDSDKMEKYLYYADPCMLFDYCKSKHSKNVVLFHDYDLYEFTITVKI